MAYNYKIHSLNMAIQANKIKSIFPDSSISFNQYKLTWKYTVTPSPLSNSYDLKLSYEKGNHPNVYVINPKLDLFKDAKKLPHVYDSEKQRLCLYYPVGNEWNSGMLISETIIPWTCEWLLHYECWIGTGDWHGGGIHINVLNKK
jgi:hypothetical protein